MAAAINPLRGTVAVSTPFTPSEIAERRAMLAAGGVSSKAPWKVVPSGGKPIIASDRGGNLFRGYIATWQEAELACTAVNDYARLLDAVERLLKVQSEKPSCAASPDHGDIMETIKNASDDWQKRGYSSALAEVRDMANVGRALMEALPEGYNYMNCPSEIVSDLQNERDEARAVHDAECGGGLRQSAAKHASICDRLAGQVPIAGKPDELWWERQSALRESAVLLEYLSVAPGAAASGAGPNDLAWFSGQRRLSLSFYSPMYGDDDDQSEEWRVQKESGPINDREWDIVGRGASAAEAIVAARATLATDQHNEVKA